MSSFKLVTKDVSIDLEKRLTDRELECVINFYETSLKGKETNKVYELDLYGVIVIEKIVRAKDLDEMKKVIESDPSFKNRSEHLAQHLFHPNVALMFIVIKPWSTKITNQQNYLRSLFTYAKKAYPEKKNIDIFRAIYRYEMLDKEFVIKIGHPDYLPACDCTVENINLLKKWFQTAGNKFSEADNVFYDPVVSNDAAKMIYELVGEKVEHNKYSVKNYLKSVYPNGGFISSDAAADLRIKKILALYRDILTEQDCYYEGDYVCAGNIRYLLKTSTYADVTILDLEKGLVEHIDVEYVETVRGKILFIKADTVIARVNVD